MSQYTCIYWPLIHTHCFHFPHFSKSMHVLSPSTHSQDKDLAITSYIHTYPLVPLLRMHHPNQPHPPPFFPSSFQHSHTIILISMHINTLFSAGLRGLNVSTGATVDRVWRISSCMYSLDLLESFCPIRSHWEGIEQRHKWVDNADHVQITTLSLSQTLRLVTRPFYVEGISWI